MLDVNLVNPFVEAAFEVFSGAMDVEISRSSLDIKSSSMTSQEVSVHIGISGDVYGQILYGMSVQTAKQIATRMIGQPIRILNDLAQSALSELGNMITGHAAAKVEEYYPHLELTPPALIIGKDVLVSTIDIDRLYVGLRSEIGYIEVSIALSRQQIPHTVSITYVNSTTTKLLV